MYTYDRIRSCYYQVLKMKSEKQKESIDKKSLSYKQELDKRANEFKRQVMEDAKKQILIIERNTNAYKKQADEEAELHNQLIDENLRKKMESEMLTLDEVQSVFDLMNS